MGADFVEKATPTFKKRWDKDRIALGTADLFTRTPAAGCATSVAEIIGNANLQIGDRLTVDVEDGHLIARRGNTAVARFPKPAAELVSGVEGSSGVAKGTVEQVYPLADMVEISLC